MAKKICFIASLSPIMSAVQIDGMDGNARIRLDVPKSHVEAILKLQKLAGKRLKVQIEEDKDSEYDTVEV